MPHDALISRQVLAPRALGAALQQASVGDQGSLAPAVWARALETTDARRWPRARQVTGGVIALAVTTRFSR